MALPVVFLFLSSGAGEEIAAPRSCEGATYDVQKTLLPMHRLIETTTLAYRSRPSPFRQPQGCVSVASRLRVAIHGSQIGQRYLDTILLGHSLGHSRLRRRCRPPDIREALHRLCQLRIHFIRNRHDIR